EWQIRCLPHGDGGGLIRKIMKPTGRLGGRGRPGYNRAMASGRPSSPINRRAFFRRGLRQLLQPIAEMADQLNQAAPAAKLPRPRQAEGRVSRGPVSIDMPQTPAPQPPAAPAESKQDSA